MNDVDKLIRDFKFSIAVLQSNITLLKKSNTFNDSNAISSEVGETVEDKEIRKLERIWNKEWVCPVCGKLESKAIFTPKLEIIDGKPIENKESAADLMKRGSIEPTDVISSDAARPEFSFDTQEEFDAHMKNVHGMEINSELQNIDDDEILKQYGAHYLDRRYGHEIIAGKGEGSKIRIKPQHHDFLVDDRFYGNSIKVVDKPDKLDNIKIKKRKMDILKKPSK